jgi:SAM-dependent methyltransferase
MNLRETYNRIAAGWAKDHYNDSWWIPGTKTFIELLPPGGSVLDVGCGNGQKAKALLQGGLKVTGIDFSREMILLTENYAPGGTYFVHDLFRLDDLTERFDGLYASAVVLHVAKHDVPNVLASFARRLQPGGYFYLTVKEQRLDQTKDEDVITEQDYGFSYQRFFSFFRHDELLEILRRVGFRPVYDVAIERKDTRWLQVIAQKP